MPNAASTSNGSGVSDDQYARVLVELFDAIMSRWTMR
jgi:hypothetical protein